MSPLTAWLIQPRFTNDHFTSWLGFLNVTVFRWAPYRLARIQGCYGEFRGFAWVPRRQVQRQ